MNYDEFLIYLSDICGYSPKTLAAYAAALSEFVAVENMATAAEVSPGHVRDFVAHMRERGLAPASCNLKLSAIRSFFDYLCRFEGLKSNPAAAVKPMRKPKRLPGYIEDRILAEILARPCGRSFASVRERCAILLLYHCGLRCHELVSLTVQDIDFENSLLRVVGKGDKERFVPFGRELAIALRAYIPARPCASSPFVMQTKDGAALDDWQLRRIVAVGLTPWVPRALCHPHALRHSFATTLLNHGARLESVRVLLGHASLDSTLVYVHCSSAYLRSTVDKVFER